MIEQQGKVTNSDGGRIEVRLGASSGCSACDAGKGCGAGVFGRLLRRKPVTLEFENSVDAAAGQAVVVGLPESMFMALVARLYLYPLLAGLAGAVAGQLLATVFEMSGGLRDIAALSGGLAAAIFTIRRTRRSNAEFSGKGAVHLLRKVECQDFE